MKLVKIKDFIYNVLDGENVAGYLGVNNGILTTNLKEGVLIDIFQKYISKIKDEVKKDHLVYYGDSPYIRNNFYCEEDKVIVFLRPYSYLIKSEFIAEKFIRKLFKERGNWKEYTNKNPDFLLKEGVTVTKDKRLWLNSLVSNLVDPESSIIQKKNRHREFVPEALNKFLPDQESFSLSPTFNVEKYRYFFQKYPVAILKPVDGFGGKGITIHDNFDSFKKRIEKIRMEKKADKWSDRKEKIHNFSNRLHWVLDEYVIDPLLYDFRKFHIRVYFIWYSHLNIRKAYIYDKIRLAIAEEKYTTSNYENTKIHDTHYVVKDIMELVYLDETMDKKDYSHILDQIKMLFTAIGDKMDTKCYKESKRCYQIFAADIMIDSEKTIKLLEINNQPGFNLELNTSGILLENIMYNIVDEILPPLHKVPNPGNFITLIDNKIPMYSVFGRIEGVPVGNYVDKIASVWYSEGFGPLPKKDKTGGYYLETKCGGRHIHVVGINGKYHPNSWSLKGEERRRWENLDFRLTPKEQTYHIYVKSGIRKE